MLEEQWSAGGADEVQEVQEVHEVHTVQVVVVHDSQEAGYRWPEDWMEGRELWLGRCFSFSSSSSSSSSTSCYSPSHPLLPFIPPP